MDKKNKINLIPFLLGLICCQNIIYLFKVNNTYINIVQIFSFGLIVYYLITNKSKVLQSIKNTNKYFKLFYILIFFSLIQSSLLIITSFENISIFVYFTGLITYFLAYCYYICVIYNKEHINDIVFGLKIGFIINIIVSLIQYIQYNNGLYFTLYNFFPQESYIISVMWENRFLAPIGSTITPAFKASGLFLESSHYIAFYGIILLILLNFYKKKNFLFKTLLIISIFLLINSLSGTTVILIISIGLYILFSFFNNRNKIKKKTIFKIVCSIFLFLAVILFLGTNNNINIFLEKVLETIKTSNIFDETNQIRFTFMNNAIKTYFKYPFGIGINMAPAVLKILWGSVATFNYWLTVLLELGPIGLISYLLIFISNILWLRKNSKSYYDIALLVSCFTILILQFSNGIYFTNSYIILLLALIQIRKEEVNIENEKI